MHVLYPFRHGGESVVDAGQVAARVCSERRPVGHLPFEGQNELSSEVLNRQRHGKAPVAANLQRIDSLDLLAGFQNCGSRVVLVGEHIAPHQHTGKSVFGVRMLRQRFHIGFQTGNRAFAAFDLFRKIFEKIILQPVLLALVTCFEQAQL
ncbi:hypothetical protein SDC9_117457 [bioreactor metagenome]|uniref:Uncharacterized protein n=1 Tax=bioreactor metagenome TaxID=1076179 RepID=A0A645BYT2_9ZZZZ